MGKQYAAIAVLALLPIMTETTFSETAPASREVAFDNDRCVCWPSRWGDVGREYGDAYRHSRNFVRNE